MRRAQAALIDSAIPLLSRVTESLEQIRPLSRLFVRDSNRIIPIPLASLERAQGADDYVTICTVAKQYLVSIRLSDLEERLRGANFLRIHRSHLITLEFVTSIDPSDASRTDIVLN